MPVNLPDWMPKAILDLMETAEEQFGGEAGAAKKAWVIAAARDMGRKIDIKAIPDSIEDPIIDALIGGAIEILWAAIFKGRRPVLVEAGPVRAPRLPRVRRGPKAG